MKRLLLLLPLAMAFMPLSAEAFGSRTDFTKHPRADHLDQDQKQARSNQRRQTWLA